MNIVVEQRTFIWTKLNVIYNTNPCTDFTSALTKWITGHKDHYQKIVELWRKILKKSKKLKPVYVWFSLEFVRLTDPFPSAFYVWFSLEFVRLTDPFPSALFVQVNRSIV